MQPVGDYRFVGGVNDLPLRLLGLSQSPMPAVSAQGHFFVSQRKA